MLNSVLLHTFKTLVEIGHFTRTANKLHMTQPGVSQHVKKLEAACASPLLRREGKRFELTEQGRLVYQYAVALQVNEHRLLESLAFDDPGVGECLLACSGALALMIYPKLLVQAQRHPRLCVSLEAAPNYKILDDLSQNNIDVGIVTQTSTQAAAGALFDMELIGEEPLCLVLPAILRGQVITTQLLYQCGLINHPDAAHYLSLYVSNCGDSQLKDLELDRVPVSSYVNQLTQILLPVSLGLGFTVLPKSAVDAFADPASLLVHEPASTVNELLYLVKKKHRALPKRYDALLALIRDSVKSAAPLSAPLVVGD